MHFCFAIRESLWLPASPTNLDFSSSSQYQITLKKEFPFPNVSLSPASPRDTARESDNLLETLSGVTSWDVGHTMQRRAPIGAHSPSAAASPNPMPPDPPILPFVFATLKSSSTHCFLSPSKSKTSKKCGPFFHENPPGIWLFLSATPGLRPWFLLTSWPSLCLSWITTIMSLQVSTPSLPAPYHTRSLPTQHQCDPVICDNMDSPWGHYSKWNK